MQYLLAFMDLRADNNNMEKNDLEIDNLPNRLTIIRMVIVPVVIVLLLMAHPQKSPLTPENANLCGWIAGWICVFASITDFFDGYIARKKNIVTVFGSFLDPIADKFLVVSSLIMLMYLDRLHAFVVVVLVLRELYMTSLRLLASSEGIKVPVNIWGKLKTTAQMIAIPMLMANEDWFFLPLPILGKIFIYFSLALSVISATGYSMSLVQKLKEVRIVRRERKKVNEQGEIHE